MGGAAEPTPGVAMPLCDITEDWVSTALFTQTAAVVVVVGDGWSGDPGYMMGPLNRVHRTKPKIFFITYFSFSFFRLPATPLVNVTIRLCGNVYSARRDSALFVCFGRTTLQCRTCSKYDG